MAIQREGFEKYYVGGNLLYFRMELSESGFSQDFLYMDTFFSKSIAATKFYYGFSQFW